MRVISARDGSPATEFGQTTTGSLGTASHTYADGTHDYLVTVNVTDKDGATDVKTFTVHVGNVNPTITAPANQSSNEGSSASFNLGSFADPGPDSPWHVKVAWGDLSSVVEDRKSVV